MACRVPCVPHSKKDNSQVFLTNAKRAYRDDNYATAFESFVLYFDSLEDPSESSSAIQSAFTKVVCQMGAILEETNNIEELLKCYIQALNFFPDNVTILCNLGVYMFKNEEIDIARRYLQRAVNVNKNYLPAETNLMHVKWHQIPRWHFRMLNDKRRNLAYEKAISIQVNRGYNHIIDIGAGSGLLSLCAAKNPGTKVTAVEENKILAQMCVDIMKANDLSDVYVVQSNSTDLTEAVCECNLIVTEVFDVALFGEQAIETIAHASTVLRTLEGYKIIPCAAKLFVTGISSDILHVKHRIALPRSIELLNLQNLVITEDDLEPYEAEDLSNIDDVSYLTETGEVYTINFYDPSQIVQVVDGRKTRVHLKCMKPGVVHALALWFHLSLTETVSITNDPQDPKRAPCWEQAVVHIDRPVVVAEGDVLTVYVSLQNSRLNVVMSEHSEAGETFKVSKDVVSFLNDEILVESIVRLAEKFEDPGMLVLDYNVAPLLGMLLAKRGHTVIHAIKNDGDEAFFSRVLDLNDIPQNKFIMQRRFLVKPIVQPYVFFHEIVGRDGLLESNGLMMSKPDEMALMIPQEVFVQVQLVYSSYIQICNVVQPENVLDFRIAEFINEYSGYQHPNLEKLKYTEHSEPIKFPLDDGIQFAKLIVTQEGLVNALYVWYDKHLYQGVVFSTKHSTHYKKVCFFLKEPVKVQAGERFTVKMHIDGIYMKISLDEHEIS